MCDVFDNLISDLCKFSTLVTAAEREFLSFFSFVFMGSVFPELKDPCAESSFDLG